MPVISNANVSPELVEGTDKSKATVTWNTDVDCNSTVIWSKDGIVQGRLDDLDNYVQAHSMVIEGLDCSATYTVKMQGKTERGQACSCDAISPGEDCSLDFQTPAAGGPADNVTVQPEEARTTMGTSVSLTITATRNGGSSPGIRDVSLLIHNGNDRGTFTPAKPKTDSNGVAVVSFNPLKKGKAQIQVLVDTATDNSDVIVN